MSDAYYGLSKMEYNLMKYFWNNNGSCFIFRSRKILQYRITL